jgi:hypothetical protein
MKIKGSETREEQKPRVTLPLLGKQLVFVYTRLEACLFLGFNLMFIIDYCLFNDAISSLDYIAVGSNILNIGIAYNFQKFESRKYM